MKDNGFTLLEVLISIMILATVLSTVFASYSGTFRIVDETESQAEIYHMARTALERMLEDLESLFVPAERHKTKENETSDIDAQRFIIEGIDDDIGGQSADSLRFPSQARIVFGEEGQPRTVAEIRYFVEEEERSGRLTLFREETNLLEANDQESSRGVPLCENLASVEFKYMGLEGDEEDSWDPEQGIPRMVFVSLGFVNPSNPEASLLFTTNIAVPAGIASEVEEE